MEIRNISPHLAISPQINVEDIAKIAELGIKAILNNRPDHESDDQPMSASLAAEANRLGLAYRDMPIVAGRLTEADVDDFRQAMADMHGPVLAFCRTGIRCMTLWALAQAARLDADAILRTARGAEFDIDALRPRLCEIAESKAPPEKRKVSGRKIAAPFDVVIVGGGSTGIAVAASLLQRRHELDIAIIEPRQCHFYEPGFSLVAAGVFDRSRVVRRTAEIMPPQVRWIRTAAAGFEPEANRVVLEDGGRASYRYLVVAPGLKLDWDAIPGLRESLGSNGVTSSYRQDMAEYTWQLMKDFRAGRAIFTQPATPIKLADTPLSTMFLGADHWSRSDVLQNVSIEFHTAADRLFPAEAYLPTLMEYVRKYNATVSLSSELAEVDGPGKRAWFDVQDGAGGTKRQQIDFDLLNVSPPQSAPDFVINSPIAGTSGWVDVHQTTLRHGQFENVYGLGDACSAPNLKSIAAVRVQAPVVAENIVAALAGREPRAAYDGYGGCLLALERGKAALAEFGYDGSRLPSMPRWLVDGASASRRAWFLGEHLLPAVYYKLILKGREWLAEPRSIGQSQKTFDALKQSGENL